MADQDSLFTAIAKQQRHLQQRRQQQQQQQQQQSCMSDVESEAQSLLDVDSELPLTFALDTQMLPLPAVSRSDSTWTSRILEFLIYGS